MRRRIVVFATGHRLPRKVWVVKVPRSMGALCTRS